MKAHDLGNRFRRERMRRFLELVPRGRRVRILDLGGTAAYWRALPGLYGDPDVEITILNLDGEETVDRNLVVGHGDACAVEYADLSFDIVHSNSVIEHVGDWPRIAAMAHEVRRLAPAYFIQTPNYWFPVEPHYRMPGVQWLPAALKRAIVRDEPERIRLLTAGEMRRLFPDSILWRERFAGLTKSLVAIRSRRDA